MSCYGSSNGNTLNFYLGESKIVQDWISSKTGKKNFNIASAEWEIFTKSGTRVNGGSAQIDNEDKVIQFLITPSDTGQYELVITYTIGNQRFIDKASLVVR